MLLNSKLQRRVATCLWEDRGKPEREPGDPSTVGFRDYEEMAFQVMHKLDQLGYELREREVVPRGTR